MVENNRHGTYIVRTRLPDSLSDEKTFQILTDKDQREAVSSDSAGATFRYECEAGTQDLDAEIVVIAAGSWSRQVGAALVGETSWPGVSASCGFSGHGVMHSPAIADNLAAMILGQTPPLDISSLSPLRTEPLIDATQV
jgi:glycine/D-amino acid oxidase-like deaminating enzyme